MLITTPLSNAYERKEKGRPDFNFKVAITDEEEGKKELLV